MTKKQEDEIGEAMFDMSMLFMAGWLVSMGVPIWIPPLGAGIGILIRWAWRGFTK